MERYLGDNAEDDIGWALAFTFIVCFVGTLAYSAIKGEHEHKQFFAEHQCKYDHSEPTGNLIYAGKGQAWREQQLLVYRCRDGTFTEVQ